MENFNQKYTKWKADMVNLINEGGIPLAVVDDFLTTIKREIAVTLAQEEVKKETESVEEEERRSEST